MISKIMNKKTNPDIKTEFVFFFLGGDKGIRTPGLRIANAALYQLSYKPELSVPEYNSIIYKTFCQFLFLDLQSSEYE